MPLVMFTIDNKLVGQTWLGCLTADKHTIELISYTFARVFFFFFGKATPRRCHPSICECLSYRRAMTTLVFEEGFREELLDLSALHSALEH